MKLRRRHTHTRTQKTRNFWGGREDEKGEVISFRLRSKMYPTNFFDDDHDDHEDDEEIKPMQKSKKQKSKKFRSNSSVYSVFSKREKDVEDQKEIKSIIKRTTYRNDTKNTTTANVTNVTNITIKKKNYEIKALQHKEKVIKSYKKHPTGTAWLKDENGRYYVATNILPPDDLIDHIIPKEFKKTDQGTLHVFECLNLVMPEDKYSTKVEKDTDLKVKIKKNVNKYYSFLVNQNDKVSSMHLVLDAESGQSSSALISAGVSPNNIVIPNNTSAVLGIPNGPRVVALAVQEYFQLEGPLGKFLIPDKFGSVFLDLMCSYLTIIKDFKETLFTIFQKMEVGGVFGITYCKRTGKTTLPEDEDDKEDDKEKRTKIFESDDPDVLKSRQKYLIKQTQNVVDDDDSKDHLIGGIKVKDNSLNVLSHFLDEVACNAGVKLLLNNFGHYNNDDLHPDIHPNENMMTMFFTVARFK